MPDFFISFFLLPSLKNATLSKRDRQGTRKKEKKRKWGIEDKKIEEGRIKNPP